MHLGFTSMNTPEDPPPPELARTLEDAGFESLWYGEHSHIPRSRRTPYPVGGELPEPYKRIMDPYLSLMAAAAATERLKLGTGIALLMERELFSQAKTIDVRRQPAVGPFGSFGRDPDRVEISLTVMAPITADLLKGYRDLGV